MTNIFTPSTAYKPFKFPWAFKAWNEQQQMHWMFDEVPMKDDVTDWNVKLNDDEKQFLTHVFRFFTQGDIDVASAYTQLYLPSLRNNEIQMMLLAIAASETTHIAAYSHLIETLGLPDSEYNMFNEYKAMRDKHEFMSVEDKFPATPSLYDEGVQKNMIREFLKDIVTFSVLGEGLQLFSSFAMLLNFPRHGKMKGMGQIVTWSIRDESLHVECMTKVFNTIVEEFEIDRKELTAEIHEITRTMVDLEDGFIELAFSSGAIQGLTIKEVEQYIRYIADRRLQGIGIEPLFSVDKNPLPWLAEMVNAPEHANFFEQKPTEYAKSATQGDWDIKW